MSAPDQTATPLQQSPYLRVQRLFPGNDVKALSKQVDNAYIDIATKVNLRTIGIFGTGFQIITGEKWYLTGGNQRQQTLRQVYEFGQILPGAVLDIPTKIDPNSLVIFTKIYGQFKTVAGNTFRPIPYLNPNTLSDGVGILVRDIAGVQNVEIVVGVTSPTIASGFVVLEWLSQF